MNIFDIMGPIMVGPSSSHTAGAARIGLITRRLLGEQPVAAALILHGSFAATGRGHGTDRALVAGLLGLPPDDPRLPQSFVLAREAGMDLSVSAAVIRGLRLEVESWKMICRSASNRRRLARNWAASQVSMPS